MSRSFIAARFTIPVWGFIKLWKFWFQMIFGGLGRAQPRQGGLHPIAQPMVQATKDCPYCAEPILVKARKCKHCGSDSCSPSVGLTSLPSLLTMVGLVRSRRRQR